MKKSMILLIVCVLALMLCGTVAAAKISYGTAVESNLFEALIASFALIVVGAACSKSGKSRGSYGGFDDNDGGWDSGGFDGGD